MNTEDAGATAGGEPYHFSKVVLEIGNSALLVLNQLDIIHSLFSTMVNAGLETTPRTIMKCME
jgi:hypothetical protein